MISLGLLFSFLALISWGFGDFFIQRTSRALGIVKALFYIGLGGTIIFLPFVYKQFSILAYDSKAWWLLGFVSVITLIAALFDFEALKEGKISIIEPIMGLELPLTVALGVLINQELLSGLQFLFIATVFLGLFLTVNAKKIDSSHFKYVFEKGVILAGVGTVAMALTNFSYGVSSQKYTPELTLWFVSLFLTLFCFVYLLARKQFTPIKDFKRHPKLIILETILDNMAWLSFGLAVVYLPISISITISESYIALASILGIKFNGEKLKLHQKIGAVITIIGILALAVVTEN